jgi:hypothetical protein
MEDLTEALTTHHREPRQDEINDNNVGAMIDEVRREGESHDELWRRLQGERLERFIPSFPPRMQATSLRTPLAQEHGASEGGQIALSDSEDEDFISLRSAGRPSAEQGEEEDREDEESEELEVEDGDEADAENDESTNSLSSLAFEAPLPPNVPIQSADLPEEYLQLSKDQLLVFTHGATIEIADILPQSPNPLMLIHRRLKPPCSHPHHHRRDQFPFLQVPHPHHFPRD